MAKNTTAKNVSVTSDICTILLALAFVAVVATVGYVAYKCHSDYETIFKIVAP